VKILVICSDTGVRIGDSKGASLHLRAISHAFAALGHQVEVVGVAASDHAEQVRWRTPINLVPHPGRSSGIEREHRKLSTVRSVHTLADTVARRFGPDVVYERLSLFGNAGRQVAREVAAQHVLEVNALLAEEEAAYRSLYLVDLAHEIERSVLRSADLRVAVSDELARSVRSNAPGMRTLVVPNGADIQLFGSAPDRVTARVRLCLPPDRPLLVFTGTLRRWHGLDVAISALAGLPDRVQLVIAGEGDLRADLVRHARLIGVADRIHWLGKISHDRVPEVLAAGDIALAPYPDLPHFAFSPLKLYEYLAAGIPVIASDVGQISGVLDHGRFGRLVTPGDPHALAAAVRAELSDPAGGRRAAARAREFALARHSWTERAQRILHEITPSAERESGLGTNCHALAP
jgi:glycosyltransferase involved in cell wall biosynthesis